MIHEWLVLMRDLLAEDGGIYVKYSLMPSRMSMSTAFRLNFMNSDICLVRSSFWNQLS
jgi:hypothetical protein